MDAVLARFERKVAQARREYLRERRRRLALALRLSRPSKRRGPCVSRGISEQLAENDGPPGTPERP